MPGQVKSQTLTKSDGKNDSAKRAAAIKPCTKWVRNYIFNFCWRNLLKNLGQLKFKKFFCSTCKKTQCPGTDYQCDEYPFASTTNPTKHVQLVEAEQNGSFFRVFVLQIKILC